MNGTVPASQPASLADLEQVRRQVRADDEFTGEMLDELHFRLVALEEILAARWPRSILVRHRLAKRIRASVAEIEGETFTSKRHNTIGTGWRDYGPPWRTGPKWS